MPKKGKQKADKSRGRRRNSEVSAGRSGQRRNSEPRIGVVSEMEQIEEGDGTLKIGGVLLQCTDAGDICRMELTEGRRRRREGRGNAAPAPGLRASEGESGDALHDYLENLADHDDEGAQDAEVQDLCAAMHRFGRAHLGDSFMGDAPPSVGSMTSTSSEASGEGTLGYDSDPSISDVARQIEGGLSLTQRFPVCVRPRPLPGGVDVSGLSQLGGVRRAGHGRLMPGEKRRLKRAKVAARRAARADAAGCDPALLAAQLEAFVHSGGDMKAFPPMGQYAVRLTLKMATLFGLKGSQQGARKKVVLVASTDRTALPGAEGQQKLRGLIQTHNVAVAALRTKRKAPHSPPRRPAHPDRALAAAAANGEAQSRFSRAVGFVSHGTLDWDMPSEAALPGGRGASPPGASSAASEQSADALTVLPEWGTGRSAHAAPALHYDADDEPVVDSSAPLRRLRTGLGHPKRNISDLGSSSQVTGSDEERAPPAGHEGLAALRASAFATKQQYTAARRKQGKLQRRAERAGTGGAATSGVGPEAMDAETALNFGSFEQHTSGFGSKMLARWGFGGQGSGLGRREQGMAEPLQVSMRPKKLGLGA